MAAILRLRRGTSTPTLLESELFFNSTNDTIIVGQSTGNHTLVKIGSNTGDISFSGDVSASNLTLSGNAVIDGNITLGGSIYLGDDSADNIIISASLSGSLIPTDDGIYDLGASNKRYDNLYVNTASIENLNVGGSGILSSSQQITDYNTFLEIDGMNVVSGSSQIDLTQTTNYISGIKTRLNTETVISGSSQVDITQTDGYTTFSSSIATTDEEQNDRLDNIETYTSSLDVTFEEIASSTHTLVSGSSQIDVNTTQNFQTFSSSVDTRLDEVESTSSINETNITELFSTSSDHESRVDELEVTGSDHETRIDSLESFSSSLDDTFVTETELNLATSSLSASLTETDVDFESRITEIETTFSSSVDSRLDSQETFSSSIDTTIKTKMNLDGVLSGSTQITNGSGILSSSNEDFNTFSSSIDVRVDSLETTFSSSVDSRLDSLEGDSHTHSNKTQLDTINQNLSNTSNVTFNDITASGNVIVSGDLTVLGDATEIQTSELRIEDKLITVASGSTNSAEADGAGIEIDGAGKSIIWDDATQSFILNAQVSSSVGFKGDGSELTGVTADSVAFEDITGKPTLVSGSSQISFNGITDKPTLFSGSSQVNADTIVNFDSNVKDKLNLDGIVSQSSQIDVNATQNFTTFSSSVDSRLDSQESFSSSVDTLFEEISSGTNTLVSGSSQVDVTQTTNIETIATTGSNVFVGNQTITGSLTTSGSVSFEQIPWPLSGNESHFFKTEPFTVMLESGSRSYDYAGFGLEHFDTLGDVYHNSLLMYMYDDHGNPTYGTEINLAPVRSHFKIDASGSDEQAGITIMDNQNGTTLNRLYGTEINIGGGSTDFVIIGSGTTDNTINGLNTNVYSPITSSTTIQASAFIGDGSQLTGVIADAAGLPDGLVSGSSQIDVTQTTNYSSIRQYDDTDTDTRLNTLGVVSGSIYSSPSQGTLRATINGNNSDVDLGLKSIDIPTFGGITLNSLTSKPSGSEFTILLQSSSNEIVTSELASAAFYHVSSSIGMEDDSVIGTAGAMKRYIDEQFIIVGAGDITEVIAGDGLSGGAQTGSATLTLDTGSQHFIDGIKVNSDQVTQSLDTRYVNVSGDTVSGDLVITGDLTVNGSTTTISTTNLNIEDNIIELNYGGSATVGGIFVKDATGVSTTSGSLLWDAVNDYWITGKSGSESRIITTADNVITDSNIKDTLNTEGVISGSSQILEGSGILSSSTEDFTTFSSSVDTRIDSLESFSSSLDNTFVTETELNTATQSLQDSIDTKLNTGSYNTDSSSFDSRVDSLEAFSSSLDNTFVTEVELNTATQSLQDSIDTKLNTGSYNTDSQSFDTRIDDLETFSSSLDNTFVTETELNTATQSLVNSIGTKLNTGSYNTDSQSFDSRIDSLEGVTSENPLTFNDTTTVDLIRTGDVITANVIGGVVSGSGQVDLTQTTNYVSGIKTRLNTETVISGSSQILDGSGILSSSNETFTAFSTSIDSRFDSLEGTTHTHSNKSNLDTINQNLSTTSDVQFNDIQVDGTGSFASDVTIYGDLNVFGTQSIINSENLAIADNMIYLNSGSTITNPDLGWAGNYNDGSYAHLGLFADASDSNTFKVYKGYTPEPEGEINTAHASFELADFQSNINTSVTSSTQRIDLISESIVRGYVEADSGGTYIISDGGIGLYTDNGTDGIVIAQNGNTTIYGSLTLQTIPSEPSALNAVVVGSGNTLGYRALGSSAFLGDASTSVKGAVELATNTEVTAGSDTTRVITPSSLTSISKLGTIEVGDVTQILPTGVVSGSSQIDYDSIQNQPIIPTNNDQLTNGAGYITGYTESDTLATVTGRGSSTSTAITFSNTTQSTTNTTGAVIVSGGVGIAKTLNVGEDVVAFASSDKRLKDNILPISNPLQKINSIGGYSFDWNVEKQHIYKGKDYGVIAQEIEEILPELVDTRENGYKAVKYDKLVSLLIEGIKELSSEVQNLKKQINN